MKFSSWRTKNALTLALSAAIFLGSDYSAAGQVHPSMLSGSFQIEFPLNSGKMLGAGPGISVGYLKGLTPKIDLGICGDMVFRTAHVPVGNSDRIAAASARLSPRFRFRTTNHNLQPFLAPEFGVGLQRQNVFFSWASFCGAELRVRSVYGLVQLGLNGGGGSQSALLRIGIGGILGRSKNSGGEQRGRQEILSLADVDSDGIPDASDSCIFQKGAREHFGCPDADGDGIIDKMDKCPTSPGVTKYYGCPVPDSDQDGINDEEDRCPVLAGVARYSGCPIPDSDGDGLSDDRDSCISEAGPRANNGCPNSFTQLESILNTHSRHISFRLGSSSLELSSLPYLDSIAALLQFHPNLEISVIGHTDNLGNSKLNLKLSNDRSAAVVNYLMKNGVSRARMTSLGMGASNPLIPNKTEIERAINRRVEIKIVNTK